MPRPSAHLFPLPKSMAFVGRDCELQTAMKPVACAHLLFMALIMSIFAMEPAGGELNLAHINEPDVVWWQNHTHVFVRVDADCSPDSVLLTDELFQLHCTDASSGRIQQIHLVLREYINPSQSSCESTLLVGDNAAVDGLIVQDQCFEHDSDFDDNEVSAQNDDAESHRRAL